MKRAAAVLTAIAALSVVGIAYSAKSPTGFPNGNSVFGGGHYVVGTADNQQFSITAINGNGTLVDSAAQGFVAQINCLNVSVNVAAVEGTVVSSNGGSLNGDAVEMWFEDVGQPSNGSVGGDQVSSVFLPDTPPKTCPAADITSVPGGLHPLDAGDIAVHAKGA